MEKITTIRPSLLEVLTGEIKGNTSLDCAERKLQDISKEITRRLDHDCSHEKNVLADEVLFARMLLHGLYAEEGSSMRKVASDFIKAAAKDQGNG